MKAKSWLELVAAMLLSVTSLAGPSTPRVAVIPDHVVTGTTSSVIIRLPDGMPENVQVKEVRVGSRPATVEQRTDRELLVRLPATHAVGPVDIVLVDAGDRPLATGQVTYVAAADTGCAGVAPIPRFPFITIAEFDGRKNLSKVYWEGMPGFSSNTKSSIRICFDRQALTDHPVFGKGALSLAATIGDRAIEVDGYSEVGTPQTRRSPELNGILQAARSLEAAGKTDNQAEYDAAVIKDARNIAKFIKPLLKSEDDAKSLSAMLGRPVPLIKTKVSDLDEALAAYAAAEPRSRGDKVASVEKVLDEMLSDEVRDRNQTYEELVNYFVGSNVQDGEIFLSKADAKAGDILRIYLLHYNENEDLRDPNAKPVRYTLAEVGIDEYGYHRVILDSFLLIKRLHEPRDNSGAVAANVAPSNFKGTGGVSLLWSKTARPFENRMFRVVSPSWGFNVSYLNWDTKKEIEIGAGFVAGLFDNQVHLGYGWNLNADRDRSYAFVGFSFAAIEKKLTGKEAAK